MIINLYACKNRLSGIFERPYGEDVAKEDYVERLTQSLALANIELLNRHKEFDVYYVGSFDSKSGEIVSSCEFLASLESICETFILAKKGQKLDGHEA